MPPTVARAMEARYLRQRFQGTDSHVAGSSFDGIASLSPWPGGRQLKHALGTYVKHYNAAGPHRGLRLETPRPSVAGSSTGNIEVVTCSAGSSMSTDGLPESLELTL